MGDKAHGVAHVMFADVDVAVDGTKQVDAQRAFVLAKEGFFYPIFYLLFHAWREAYMPTDSLVGKEDITPVNALGGFEERVADKMQLFTAKKVFQGEIVGHLVSGLGDNTTSARPVVVLLSDDFFDPCGIVGCETAGNPSQAPPRPRPRGFENYCIVGIENVRQVGKGVDGLTVGLEGQDGSAVL